MQSYAWSSGNRAYFFYRPSGVGVAVIPDVVINGETVGRAVGQGFFYIERPAGEYTVVSSTEVERKVSFVLEQGQTRYVRFKVSIGFFVGHFYGEMVDKEQALPDIQRCNQRCKLIEEKSDAK